MKQLGLLILGVLAISGAVAQTAASAVATSAPTGSGLIYRSIKDGNGASPAASDVVRVHYRGTFPDGREFDSSIGRGQPAEFPLNRVIPGWTEGLQLMPTGSKYRLYIPSELGYGARGAGGDIPPHAALIFDVELISIR
mgnify:CR=1 FL=1